MLIHPSGLFLSTKPSIFSRFRSMPAEDDEYLLVAKQMVGPPLPCVLVYLLEKTRVQRHAPVSRHFFHRDRTETKVPPSTAPAVRSRPPSESRGKSGYGTRLRSSIQRRRAKNCLARVRIPRTYDISLARSAKG